MSDFTDYEAKFHEWDFSAANGVRVGPRPVASDPRAGSVFVSPTGTGDGLTYATPTDFVTGRGMLKNNEVLFFLGGVYPLAGTMQFSGGLPGAPKHYESYPGEIAIFEPADPGIVHYMMRADAPYTTLRRLELRNGTSDALIITGNNSVVQGVYVHDIANGGFHILHANAQTEENWDAQGSYILVEDCIAQRCSDEVLNNGQNADGFITSQGVGNVIRYCESEDSSDDGFDAWQGIDTRFEYCVSHGSGIGGGDGNGYKLGGPAPGSGSTTLRCLAYDNLGFGYSQNAGVNETVESCSELNNTVGGYDTNATMTTITSVGTGAVSGVQGVETYNSWNRAGTMAYVSEVPYSAGFMVPVAGFDDIGAMSVLALSNPQNTPEPDGATLTIDSNSDLGTLYSYSKTTPFTGTEAQNAAEIIAQGVGQAPVVGTNTRVVTGQDTLTDHYAGWVQDSDGYGADLAMVYVTTAPLTTITFPCVDVGIYDAQIDWGDGNGGQVDTFDSAVLSHEFADAGEYIVRIAGSLPHLKLAVADVTTRTKLVRVENYGDVGTVDASGMFSSCTTATEFSSQSGAFAGVTNHSGTFQTTQLAESIDVRHWDMRAVDSLQNFMWPSGILTPPDISRWETDVLRLCMNTFRQWGRCTSPPELGALRMDSVINASGMCQDWTAMGAADVRIDLWNIPKVTDFTNFMSGSQLTTACYDRTLASWGNQTLAAGALSTTIHFGSSTYTDQASKDLLLAQCAGIIDGGVAP